MIFKNKTTATLIAFFALVAIGSIGALIGTNVTSNKKHAKETAKLQSVISNLQSNGNANGNGGSGNAGSNGNGNANGNWGSGNAGSSGSGGDGHHGDGGSGDNGKCKNEEEFGPTQPDDWSWFGKNDGSWHFAGDTNITRENVNTLMIRCMINVTSRNVGVSIVGGILTTGFISGDVGAWRMNCSQIWFRPASSFTTTLTGALKTIYSSPTVGSNCLYVAMAGGDVWALDRATGVTLGHAYIDMTKSGGSANTAVTSSPILIENANILVIATEGLGGAFVVNQTGTVQYFTAWPLSASPYRVTQMNIHSDPTAWNYGMGGCGMFGTIVVDKQREYIGIGTGNAVNATGNTITITQTSDALVVLNYRTGEHVSTTQFTKNDIAFPSPFVGPTEHDWDADGGPILMDLQLDPESPVKTRVMIVGTKEGMLYVVVYDTWVILHAIRLLPPMPYDSVLGESSESGINCVPATNGVDRVYVAVLYSYTGKQAGGAFSAGDPYATAMFGVNPITGTIEWQTTDTYTGVVVSGLTYSKGMVWACWTYGHLQYQDTLPQTAIMRVFDSSDGKLLLQYPNPFGGTPLGISYSWITIYKDTAVWSAREDAAHSHIFLMGV
jgi:hypothetical protein